MAGFVGLLGVAGVVLILFGLYLTEGAENFWRRRRKTVWVKAPPPCSHGHYEMVESSVTGENVAVLCLDCDQIAEYL